MAPQNIMKIVDSLTYSIVCMPTIGAQTKKYYCSHPHFLSSMKHQTGDTERVDCVLKF